VVGLASDAAAVAFHAGKGPVVALDLLERGRGVLAASLEEMRTDSSDLQNRYPQLAEQFDRLRNELNLPVTRNTLIDQNNGPPWMSRGDQRHEAGREFDNLIVEIRKQPGFEDFLDAPSELDMQAAALCGPIVVINVSQYRCDAILVEQHQIRHLHLPNLNSEQVREMAERGNLGNFQVLEWLWDTIANPVLDFLGFKQPPCDNKWPHIWWIPIGPLSKFPLHAAGRHGNGSSDTVLDRVISSYSSSIKTIIHSRRHRMTLSTPAKALLVAPRNSGLKFAADEVKMLHGLCKSMLFSPIQPGGRKEDITAHLPKCQIFHFAGHGCTDYSDPSRSHLLLENGRSDPLTVANILDINLRKHSPFLAYLSACGTGQTGNDNFIDESIHLISACQLAGFRHVIGTLWEVNDEFCVHMAKITYEGIRDGHMTDESVSKGLHNATRELRDHWLNMPVNARCLRRSVGKADAHLVEDQIEAQSRSDRDERDDTLPRDIILCDDDGSDDDNTTGGTKSLPWVPYVHFGV
jgi:hypothetical protein